MAELDNTPETTAIAGPRRVDPFMLLPPEILATIFAHLDLKTKGRAAQVCKAWRNVVYQKSLWRNVEVRLHLCQLPCNTQQHCLFTSLTARGIRHVRVLSCTCLCSLVWDMPNLQSLDFSSCRALTNLSLVSAIGHQPLLNLTCLNLSECELTNENMAELVKNCVHLADLDLTSCYKLTDTSLLHVGRHLVALTRLVVSYCVVSDVGISYLTGSDPRKPTAGNVKLEHLDLTCCYKLTDTSLLHVGSHLVALTRLDVSYCAVTDVGIAYLTGSDPHKPTVGNVRLEHLGLEGCRQLSDQAFRLVADKLGSLRELRASMVNARDAWLVHLADTDIEILDLSRNCYFTAHGLVHLGRMRRLLQLNLSELNGDVDFNFLAESSVSTLNLSNYSEVTDTGLGQLAMMTNLNKLDLANCTKISDAGLEHLARLPLRELNLRNCKKITMLGISHLARITELRELDLSDCNVNDAGLAYLAKGAANLSVLRLTDCPQITDAGLPYLAKMASLREVDLGSCQSLTTTGIVDLARRAPGIATFERI